MKKILFALIAILALACTKVNAQVYDGITQPTAWRVWMSVTTPTNGTGATVAPFVGYKQDVAKHFSLTAVAQYNFNNDAVIPQVWLNFDIAKKFFVLSRSIYNTKTEKYSHTMSATYKLPANFMIDATWDNLYNGTKWCDTDRLQIVGGYNINNKVIFNAGYSVRNNDGFIGNIRWKVTNNDWVQMKYDGGAKTINVAVAFHID